MRFKLNSIKYQLLLSFLPIIGFFLIAAVGVLLLLNQANRIKSFQDQLSAIDNDFELILIEELAFLQSENNDFVYHSTGKNERLERIYYQYDNLMQDIELLLSNEWLKDYDMESTLIAYRTKLNFHQGVFNKIVILVKQRGVKDFGLIGEMRKHIHFIEENHQYIKLSDVLLLRRHEKDFLLRNQPVYIDKLNQKAEEQLRYLKSMKKDKSEVYGRLYNYALVFNDLVAIIEKIGDFKKRGLKSEFELSVANINDFANYMAQNTMETEKKLLSKVNIYLVSLLIISFLGSIAVSVIMARYRSRPIVQFTDVIKDQSDLSEIELVKSSSVKGASNELRSLINSYNKLVSNLKKQFQLTEEQNNMLLQSNEKLTKVNKELDNFVYRVSHDLRAPLASILGISKLNEKLNDPKELKENSVLVEASVNRMDAFIQDIINLSRNSRTNIVPEKIDVSETVKEIVEHHKYLNEKSNIEVRIKIICIEQLYSDLPRLKVIFSNLIANAFKYSDIRKSKQHINVEGEVDKENLTIRFEDNGVGINDKYLPKVFDMFFRASYASKGSGLGLYICKESITKLGGKIEVESVEGMLTVFTLTIPNLKNSKTPEIKDAQVSDAADS